MGLRGNMGLEIERKYLLKSSRLIELLVEDGLSLDEQKVVQFYTKITNTKETRVRKIGSKYTKTTKEGSGLVRKENEKEVSPQLFKQEQKSKIGTLIDKKRYSFKLHNLPCCIDVYKGDLKGLYVMEIEFLDKEMATCFKLPSFIAQEVREEVTENSSFKNKNLALFGMPIFQEQQKLQQLFCDFENNPFDTNPSDFLPTGIDAYSAMRAIFYSLLQMILFYKQSFLQNSTSEDLHQLRVNIRKTRSLLQCIDGLFDESIAQRFINDFKIIANATNTKRDLDVFLEFLEGLDEVEAEIILELYENKKENESRAIFEMLIGEKFNRVIQDWAVVLKDEDRFFEGKNGSKPLKQIAATSLIKRLKRMQKRLSVLNEHTDITFFHKVRIEFKRLRYLTEYFLNLFNDIDIENMMTASKKMQTMFGELQDRDVGIDILGTLENSSEFCENVEVIYAINQIIELINDDIYSIRTKILMRKERLFQTLDENIENLEIYKLD